uniref:Tail tape measure protein n=1 Tax=Siphoviridae sp. ctg2r17 TaxID=2825601 RepID=A0A8S5P1G6_9CAUD|nr:MAG TPA: tail tape measure protein [Siphoviridae sp. ctg2r17]
MNQGTIVVTYKVDRSKFDKSVSDVQKKMKSAAKDNDELTKKMADSWSKIGTGFKQLGTGIKNAAIESAAIVSKELIQPITNKLAPLASRISAGFANIGNRIATFFSPMTNAASKAANAISAAFVGVRNTVANTFSNIGAFISSKLSIAANAVTSFASKVGQGIALVAQKLAAPFIWLGKGIGTILAPVAQKMIAVFGGIGGAIGRNLAPGLSTIGSGISDMFSALGGKISNAVGGMVSQVMPHINSLASGLKEKLGGALSHVSGVASGLGKAFAVGTAVAAVAIGGLAKKSVEGFAEWEQLVGGVDTLFKKSSDTVQAYAANAYKTAGLSANQYMETVTSFSASLLQGLKGDTEKSAQYAHMAVTDMADNANKMGTDIARIQDAYQGFAKDNYTMLDNLKLGYGGTAGEMARLINDTGVMGKGFKATAENVKDIPFDKLIEGIHKVQENMGITGTTAKEASETISGSFYSMKSAWSNLVAGFGNEDLDLSQLINNFTGSFETFLKNLTPALSKAIGGIAQALPQIITQLLPLIPPIMGQLLPAIIQGVIILLQGLVQSAPQWIGQIVAMVPVLVQGFMQLFMALLQAAPQIIAVITPMIPQIVDSLVTTLTEPTMLQALIMGAIQLFLAIIEALPTVINALADALPRVVDAIVTTLTQPVMLQKLGESAVKLLFALIHGIGSMLGHIGSAAWKVINKIGEVLSPSTLWSVGENFIKGLWNGINNVTGWILNKIKGFGKSVLDGIKSFFGIHSPSTVMAKMGGFLGQGFANGITDSIGGVLSAVDTMNGAISDRMTTSLSPDFSVSGNGSVALQADDIWGGKNNGGSNDGYPQINQTVNLTNGIDVDQYNRSLVQQMRRG